MLHTFLYILPCFVCLTWIVSFAFQVKSPQQKVFAWSLVASLIYYIGYSTMAQPETAYRSLIGMDVVLLPAGLTMFGALNIYMNMMLRRRSWTISYLLWLAPALGIGVAGGLLYGIIGTDTAEQVKLMYDRLGHLEAPYDGSLYNIYMWVTQNLFNILSIFMGLCLIVQCAMLMRREGYRLGYVSRFFFARHAATPGRVIATLIIAEFLVLLPIALLPEAYQHPAMGLGQSLLLALIKHCQCHVVYFSAMSREVTLHSLSHLQISGQTDSTPATTRTPAEKCPPQHVETASPLLSEVVSADRPPLANRNERLGEELRRLMDEEEVWREDDLTINTLAERLHVSRSTLSNLINMRYGIPFRDLINARRIQAVQRYMLENPTATQEDIAASCGFKTASYMNSKFKDTVGTTPLLWLIQTKQA